MDLSQKVEFDESKSCKLPDGKVMKEIDNDGYKYLGILEGATILNTQMKKKVRDEYFRWVKKVAKSQWW